MLSAYLFGADLTDSFDVRDDIDRLGVVSAGSPLRISEDAIPYLLSAADLFTILLSSAGAGSSYQFLTGHGLPNLLPYCAIGILAGLLYVLRMGGRGHYSFLDAMSPRLGTGEIISCWCVTALLLVLLAFLLKIGPDYSRGAFVVFCFLAPMSLFVARCLSKIILREAVSRRAVGRRHAVVVGMPNEIASLRSQRLLARFWAGEVKSFTLSDADPSVSASADTAVMTSAIDFVRRHDCREILLALPWTDTMRLEFVRNHIRVLPVAAQLLPDVSVRSLASNRSSECVRSLAINVQSAPLSEAQRFVKRTIDIVLALLALVFFSPIMAVTAIAIKMDSPGPVIFRQDRKGFNGRRFTIFKFRTMTVQENGAAVAQATRDDPRVTEIGRILRSTSFDELPQLFNVLMGTMSMVGPRPHALAHDVQFESMLRDYAVRQNVKPGITGWAQCNGARGATPSIDKIAERVRLDLWYVNNWSLRLDIQILAKTFVEVIKQRNAY
ncbi:undecaprenyl-phosphate glucose phosphotransferase [Bradyrhizobium sp. ORS 111]|uniref:undecaprenyl-phosphate glucose phosphotransferase n=1 Tax=Bradyrhizobium sp. ORS 111 TaxID=1685958 RepID=UPI00388FB3E1